MPLFNPLGGSVVLRSRGSYLEAPLYECDKVVYAKKGSSFIKLLDLNRTSQDKTFWGPNLDLKQAYAFEKGTSNLVLTNPQIVHLQKTASGIR